MYAAPTPRSHIPLPPRRRPTRATPEASLVWRAADVRIMPPVTDPSSALGKSWRHSLRVETREQAEAAMHMPCTWHALAMHMHMHMHMHMPCGRWTPRSASP